MADDIVFWCCMNPSCKRKNWNYKNDVQSRVIEGGEPLLCRTCGVGFGFVDWMLREQKNYAGICELTGWPARIPAGDQLPDGSFRDGNNRILSRNDYIRVNKIDPLQYSTWRKLGFPKPSRRCFP